MNGENQFAPSAQGFYDGAQRDAVPCVLPHAWRTLAMMDNGGAFLRADGLKVLASASVEQDGKRWLHVSCSRPDRLPSYDDLAEVKAIFVGRDRTALQVFAPASKHVNHHPHCLHLWSCLDGDVTPDFTRGTGTL